MSKSIWSLLMLIVAACLTSCLGQRETRLPETGATLEGIVQYGNEKLQFAMIHVVGNGQVAIGRIGEDGRYKVENCPLGEVKIGINTKGAFGEYQSKVLQGGAYKGPEAKGRGAVALKFIDVPERYADPDKSGITTTVTVGVNTFDIIIPAR